MRRKTLMLVMLGAVGMLGCKNQTSVQVLEHKRDSTTTIISANYYEQKPKYMDISTIFSPEEMTDMRRRLIKEYRNEDFSERCDILSSLISFRESEEYPDSLILTDNELAADMDDFYRILRKKSLVYKPVSDSLFAEKMKQVFDLDVKSKKISGKQYLSTYPVEYTHFYIEGSKCDGFYFDLKNRYILFGLMGLLEDHMKFVTEFEPEESEDSQRHQAPQDWEVIETIKNYERERNVYFSKAMDENYELVFDSSAIETAYHINNFIFYDNKSSFLWLYHQQHFRYFLESLFTQYSYDKDPRINKMMFDKIDVEHGYPLNYNRSVNRDLFAAYDAHKEMRIRTGLMQYVVENCYDEEDKDEYGIRNDKMVCIMEDYLDYVFANAYSSDNKREEKRNIQYKIAAYVSYYLQKAYENYRQKSGGSDPRCWHSALVNGLRDDMMKHNGSFETYVKSNRYFGLEGFDKILSAAHEDAVGIIRSDRNAN